MYITRALSEGQCGILRMIDTSILAILNKKNL